jgi:hypothetical protein
VTTYLGEEEEEEDPSDDSDLLQPSRVDPLLRDFGHLQDHPELITVVMRAVEEVIDSNDINRERDSDLVDHVERAAAAAALTTYKELVVLAIQASDGANEVRLARVPFVAATALVIAESVIETAAEVHHVGDAAADHVASVAAKAASEVAALVRFDDETAAAVAAALALKAVGEAAAVSTTARADAAAIVTQAVAADAADVAEEAASTALAAESDVINNALNSHHEAMETCYEAAAAAAAAMLTQHTGADLLQAHHHPPDLVDE